MVLRYADGFDLYDDTADMENGGVSNAGKVYAASGGRFGGGCVTGAASTEVITYAIPAPQLTTFIVAFAYFHDGNGGSLDDLLTVTASNGGVIGRVRHDASGNVLGYGNSVSPDATGSGAVLTPNEWVWVEFKILCGTNASNDGAIEMRINEIEVFTNSGIDTAITDLDVGFVNIYGSQGTHAVDDVVIIDDTTDADDVIADYTGDVRIDTLRPTANGFHQDWTPNTGTAYQALDDAFSAPDEDSTYVTSTTINHKSTFEIENPGGVASAVLAAQVRVRAKKLDAGSRNIVAVARNGSTTVDGNDPVDPGTDYKWTRAGFVTEDPNTGGSFTPSTFNSTEFGFKMNN